MAPRRGLEPPTYRLTAECSTIELPWNITWLRLTLPGGCPPSTISAQELNFCVRNGNGCYPKEHHHQIIRNILFFQNCT